MCGEERFRCPMGSGNCKGDGDAFRISRCCEDDSSEYMLTMLFGRNGGVPGPAVVGDIGLGLTGVYVCSHGDRARCILWCGFCGGVPTVFSSTANSDSLSEMLSMLDIDRLRFFFLRLLFFAFLLFLLLRGRRSLSLSSSDNISESSSAASSSSSTGEAGPRASRCTFFAGDRGVFDRELPDETDELMGDPMMTFRT